MSKLAKDIADAIISELNGRSGYGNVWDECGNATQKEIKNEMVKIIDNKISESKEK